MPEGLTPCDYARQRYRSTLSWRNLWTILLFTFGTTIVVFLSVTVLFFLSDRNVQGALSTLSTLVNGVAVKWVLDRRSDAVKEEQEAFADLRQVCGTATAQEGVVARDDRAAQAVAEAASLRERYRLFGRWL